MPNPYEAPESIDTRIVKPRTPLRYKILGSCVALIVGGGAGFAIGLVFISTPLQRILGPRYSEFDFFGVIGVSLLAPLIAVVATVIAVSQGLEKLRSTFRPRNLLSWTVAPFVLVVVLALFVDGEWAWLAVIHAASCLGILAGAGLSLWLTPAA